MYSVVAKCDNCWIIIISCLFCLVFSIIALKSFLGNKMTKKSIPLDVDTSIMEKNMRIVEESPVEEELNKLLSSVNAVPFKTVNPRPGCCIKTFTKPDKKKVFINICQSEYIPSAADITNDELMYILSSEDPSSFRVPMSIGDGRIEQDKSGAPATVYDVAVNPKMFEKYEQGDLFQTFLDTVVFEGIQDKYQIELETFQFNKLKNRKSIGTIQPQRVQIRDLKQCEEIMKPLIEELEEPKSKVENIPAQKEFIYRLRREPPMGEIEYLLAEFFIPPMVEVNNLNLEIGEDRLVLDSKGLYKQIDFFLPCSVDQDIIDAQLNRNNDLLTIKMPIIH